MDTATSSDGFMRNSGSFFLLGFSLENFHQFVITVPASLNKPTHGFKSFFIILPFSTNFERTIKVITIDLNCKVFGVEECDQFLYGHHAKVFLVAIVDNVNHFSFSFLFYLM